MMSTSEIGPDTVLSPLLRLPVEIRRIIYDFVLPFTTTVPEGQSIANRTTEETRRLSERGHTSLAGLRHREGHNVVWTRRCTALLAVSRQIHEETAAMLYGDNTFVIDVNFDAVEFYCRWKTPQGLTPNRTYSYLDHFSQRNLLRVRNYVVNVEPVDEYTGMIKYNCGGRGLLAGMRVQVDRLVKVMAGVAGLQAVTINLLFDLAIRFNRAVDDEVSTSQRAKEEAQARAVLAPFRSLRGVRKGKVEVTGMSAKYTEDVKTSMTASCADTISKCN